MFVNWVEKVKDISSLFMSFLEIVVTEAEPDSIVDLLSANVLYSRVILEGDVGRVSSIEIFTTVPPGKPLVDMEDISISLFDVPVHIGVPAIPFKVQLRIVDEGI